MNRVFYMANCIKRILECRCRINHARQRVEDIAESIKIAAASTEEAAHDYLRDLLKQAEEGKYDK